MFTPLTSLTAYGLSNAGGKAGDKIESTLGTVGKPLGDGLASVGKPVGSIVGSVVDNGIMAGGRAAGGMAGRGAGALYTQGQKEGWDEVKAGKKEQEEAAKGFGGKEQTGENPLGL